MAKKLVITIGIIAIALLIAFTIYFLTREKPYYTENPEDWIETKTSGVQEINVRKVTRGAAFLNDAGLQYDDGKILTAFDYDGMYKGEYFPTREYIDIINKKTIMAITHEMNPNDGIITGFIAEYIKGNEAIAQVFLDEDWRKQVGQTNIIWGAAFQNIIGFDFTQEISSGIYMNAIKDDPNRFHDEYTHREGGVIVGNADMTNAESDDFTGKTVIRMI